MRISAKIQVFGDAKELKKLFLQEQENHNTDRASFTTISKGKDFYITIEAADSTAFRAISNSISKLLTIYEKTDAVTQNEN